MASRRVIGIIAAAGVGARLGADTPKAYVPLRDRPLVERSVTAMVTSAIVDEIIVVVSPVMEDYAREILRLAGHTPESVVPVRVIDNQGGEERADSVWVGLQAIGDESAVVLVHDAARALTPPGMIARVASRVLEGAPAVIPVVPVADTVKRIDEHGTVVDTPSRALLRAVQTPQGFDLGLLREANAAYFGSGNPGFVATDDASLVEWYGGTVVTVPGDAMALKITTPLDFLLARTIADQVEPTIREIT